MAIDSKLSILLMFVCTAWSSYCHLSLFALVAITLSHGQDLVSTPADDKSCNGEYCSWDDEARRRDELVRTTMTPLEFRKYSVLENFISFRKLKSFNCLLSNLSYPNGRRAITWNAIYQLWG